MKRFILVLLAMMLLCSGPARAESERLENADIEELVVSREEGEYTLEQELMGLMDALRSEEVRELLNLRDVQDILSETIVGVGAWLLENRETTMKILRELGIPESERDIISKIWDTGERVAVYFRAYGETEDGKRLRQEFSELIQTPEWKNMMSDFVQLGTSEEIQNLLEALAEQLLREGLVKTGDYSEEEIAEAEESAPALDLAAALLATIENSSWAKKSMGELAKTELFQNTLDDLVKALGSDEMAEARAELATLLEDEQVLDYISRIFTAAVKVAGTGLGENSPAGGSEE